MGKSDSHGTEFHEISYLSIFFENVLGNSSCAKIWQEQRVLLISNFRRVLNFLFFLLGNSPTSEFSVPTFRNTLFVPSSYSGRCVYISFPVINVCFQEKTLRSSCIIHCFLGSCKIFCSAEVRDFELTRRSVLKYKIANRTCVSELYIILLETF